MIKHVGVPGLPGVRSVLVAALLATTAVACSTANDGDGAEPVSADAAVGTDRPATSMPPVASVPAPDGPTLHGTRYCEILTVQPSDDGRQVAEVWNTMGLNDCPSEAWTAVDLDAARATTGAALAATNGPRYWLLDRIVPGEMAGSLEVKNLGGIEMRSVALVDLSGVDREAEPYGELSVERDTVFVFVAGREIYELIAPDGSIYVMQSFSQEVDPELTMDALASLGERLELPDGWTFTVRVLTEDLEVTDDEGIATVVTDELRNTYQLRSRG